MPVLCFDPRGLVGNLLPPALLPEAGGELLIVPGLDGAHGDAVVDFVHAQRQLGVPWEIWHLWEMSSGKSEVEALASQLEALVWGNTACALHCLYVVPLSPGSASHSFLAHGGPVSERAWLPTPQRWTWVELGLECDPDQDLPALYPLVLRFWLSRTSLGIGELATWNKHRCYRLLFKHSAAALDDTRRLLAQRWRAARQQLMKDAEVLRGAPCESMKFFKLPNNLVAELRLPYDGGDPAAGRSPGSQAANLGWFFSPGDFARIRAWTGGQLATFGIELRRARVQADAAYRAQLDAFYRGDTGPESTDETPQAAATRLRGECERMREDTPSEGEHLESHEGLVVELRRKESSWLADLFVALRHRPSVRMTWWVVATAAVILGVVVAYLAQVGSAMPPADDGRWWWASSGGIILVSAVVFGLTRARSVFRTCLQTVVSELAGYWNRAGQLHAVYTDMLNRKLRLIALQHNLAIAEAAQKKRERTIAQSLYHVNRLDEYIRQNAASIPDSTSTTAVPLPPMISVDQSERLNAAYRWAGDSQPIELGVPGDVFQSAPRQLNHDGRLSGIKRIEIRVLSSP